MISGAKVADDVNEYISGFPPSTQKLLKQLRSTIKKAAPKAEEGISYRMPAYKLSGVLVYFAGYKNHIGFYPGASGVASFKKQLGAYKIAKGSIQFPLDQSLPLDLVSKIVSFRVAQNLEKEDLKKKKVKS
jgi:uncharacterized protein YdhG (YjbR/CyaY superfamily)